MRRDSILVLFFLLSSCWVICECRWATCNNETTYPYGSTYSRNVKRVMNDLLRSTSEIPGFINSSYGESPNIVYGFLQCVGNISVEKCSDCAKKANKTVSEYCGNYIGGQVWMDDCFLHYDNINFFSNQDFVVNSFPVEGYITSNLEPYKAAVTSLLANLSEKANEPANKGFAIGSANYTSSGKLYGLVQCWRFLDMDDCQSCLVYARQEAQSCCLVSKGAQVLVGSCKIRYEIYPFFGSAESMLPLVSKNTTTFPPSSSPREAHSSGKSSITLPLIIVGGLILALVICLIVTRKRLLSAISWRPLALVTHNEERQGNSSEPRLVIQEKRFMFSLEELAESTENFDENRKLGVRGFSAIYKGTTRDGKEIAVKKLSARSTQGKREFMNEVKLLTNVQHRNLVKLLGCCAEGDERLLVYEYFPNKSLDIFLFDPEKRRELSWQKRYNIIIGIARGLLYLHEDSQLKIIHSDIKAKNILLDEKLNAKIADFGIARLFAGDETHVKTNVAGTYGYMAPEYATQGQLSVKADVYSFGVLLLEIMSGRKNTDNSNPYETPNLLEWAWRLYKGEDVLNMVDSTVAETCPKEKALRSIHVGLLCVQADATVRPTMSSVIAMISSSSVPLPNLKKPAFINRRKSCGPKSGLKLSSGSGVEEYETGTYGNGTTTLSASALPSVNDTSTTQLSPR